MQNFEFKNPTKILFGTGQVAKIAQEIPPKAKVLMLYGGGSIKTNGVYQSVVEALQGYEVMEMGGIGANPEYEILMQAVSMVKEHGIDFLLAVGGGSVIDGTKFVAFASKYQGDEPWEILTRRIVARQGQALPFGVVLTLPATSSEMNSGFVISRRATGQKLGGGGPGVFPKFSILDPSVVRSIPKQQLVNGITDAYTHLLEQYMTYPTSASIQDRLIEGVLLTLHEVAPQLLQEEYNYEVAANFMWSCTLSLNGLLQKGIPTDWAVHAMAHELTAYYGIDHARTLAIVAPSHYRYYLEQKKEKLAQYAQRIWNVNDGTTQEKALKGIALMESFFQGMGIKTKLSDYTDAYQQAGERVEQSFLERGIIGIGERKLLMPSDARKIIKMSY